MSRERRGLGRKWIQRHETSWSSEEIATDEESDSALVQARGAEFGIFGWNLGFQIHKLWMMDS